MDSSHILKITVFTPKAGGESSEGGVWGEGGAALSPAPPHSQAADHVETLVICGLEALTYTGQITALAVLLGVREKECFCACGWGGVTSAGA